MYHFALGIALTQHNNCADAIPQFAEALALKPGFPAAQQQIDNCRAQISSRQAAGQKTISSPLPCQAHQVRTAVGSNTRKP